MHAANSAAVLRSREAHFDMARCGIAIYGLDPFGRDPAAQGLEPALSLQLLRRRRQARCARATASATGAPGRHPRQPASAVLPIGYGDGYRRGLSNAAEVLIGGRRRPVVGTVSMDNITVDLGPDTEVQRGRRRRS